MKRKIPVLFLLLVALLIPAAMAETMYVVTPNGERANLRTAPNTEADITDTLENGMPVETLETSGVWTKVKAGEDEAWIQSKYLSVDADAGFETAQAPEGTDSVTAVDYSAFALVDPYVAYVQPHVAGGFVNLRWAPSRDAAVQCRMSEGGEVHVFAVGAGWAQVMDQESGYIGFMQAQFLTGPETAEAID